MQDYRVELDVYHGPLDLLLYLIRRDEIDIHDIPIARITEQYLRRVETIRTLDINLAGEFLVMAATLMEIKSAMMAPREAAEGEGADAVMGGESGEAADPRHELVQQLLAYKRFKDAAHALDRRRERFAAMFPRRPGAMVKEDGASGEAGGDAEEAENAPPPIDLEDLSVWDLMEAFNRLMEQVGGPPRVDLVHDDTPLELHAADIFDRIQREGPLTLQAMFEGRRNVSEMIGLFLATLELLRQRKIAARQEEAGGAIRLELRSEDEWMQHDAEVDAGGVGATTIDGAERGAGGADGGHADSAALSASAAARKRPAVVRPDASNPDLFDWPDEQTRKRYARRMDLRARGQVVIEDAELEEDLKAMEEAERVEVEPIEAAVEVVVNKSIDAAVAPSPES